DVRLPSRFVGRILAWGIPMPSIADVICAAIRSRNLIQFNYTGDLAPGLRIVEPYMIAYTRADHLALNAWFLTGASESEEGPGWRTYRLDSVDSVTVL